MLNKRQQLQNGLEVEMHPIKKFVKQQQQNQKFTNNIQDEDKVQNVFDQAKSKDFFNTEEFKIDQFNKNYQEIEEQSEYQTCDNEDQHLIDKNKIVQKKPQIEYQTLEFIDTIQPFIKQEELYNYQRSGKYVWENQDQIDAITSNNIRILIITWNLRGQCPVNSLANLLKTNTIKHHLIVIGTQECSRSIFQSFFYENKDVWEQGIMNAAGQDYMRVQSRSLNALHLMILAHKSIHKYISYIRVDYQATGIVNIIANKGGIAISMNIGNKSYLFITCHLASGQNKVRARNNDYQKIINNIQLPQYSQTPLLDRFDYIVILGDFNYRVGKYQIKEIASMIKQHNCLPLLKEDQLLIEKSKNKIFNNFNEGFIKFPPTYRFNLGSPYYTLDRPQSWTDRILFKSKNPEDLKLANYDGAMNIQGSDHRPVYCQLSTQVNLEEQPNVPIITEQRKCVCTIF